MLTTDDATALAGIAFADREVGWAVGGGDFGFGLALLHTRDGGATWTDELAHLEELPGDPRVGHGFTLLAVSATSLQHAVAVGAREAGGGRFSPEPLIVVTDDGGDHWRIADIAGVPESVVRGPLRSVCLSSDGSGIAVGHSITSGGTMLATTDGGATWTDVFNPAGLGSGDLTEITSAACASGGRFWASGSNIRPQNVGYASDLVHSPDGGATWVGRVPSLLVIPGYPFRRLPLAFVGEHGWTSPGFPAFAPDGQSLFMRHTDDGGVTWRAQAPPDGFTGPIFALAFRDETHGVAVGDGIVVTSDGGTSWHRGELPTDAGRLIAVTSVP